MVNTIKFSQFASGGDIENNNQSAGLESGDNVLFNNPWVFLAPGSTASRPVPSSAINGRLRFNTDTLIYEYYDTLVSMWVALSGSGTGTVNPGTANAIAFYAANGTAVSPVTSHALSVLVTDVTGFPSLSNTLPIGLTIPSAIITSSTAALTSGQVAAPPVSATDIANKLYVDTAFGSGVTSITGTTNQIIASSATGAVTLSLPQDIATGSTPTFAGLTLSSIPLGASSGGTGVNNGAHTITLGGAILTAAALTLSGAFASTFTMTGITGVTFPTSGTLATTSQLVTPAPLTKTDDTNVTVTLGGSPSTALVNAASITMGWTGQLGLTRGGTAASLTASNGGIVYSTASALAILAGTATAGRMVQSGANTTPAWSTTTYPATNAVSTLLYASSANVMAALATANNGVLITSNSGVPSWLANSITAGFVLTANSGAPPSWQSAGSVTNHAPTVQKFLSGSGTYTTPTSPAPLYIRVLALGGGQGGNGSGSGGTSGSTGGNTTFGTTLIVANGGAAGAVVATASLGAAIGIAISGGLGGQGTSLINATGGYGANTIFGGGGQPGFAGPTAGIAANANTGSGGGGAGGSGATGSAAGGNAGAYVDGIIGSPAATYSYAVGAGGNGGTLGSGGAVGGPGAAGQIVVWEYYQ